MDKAEAEELLAKLGADVCPDCGILFKHFIRYDRKWYCPDCWHEQKVANSYRDGYRG